MAKIRITKEKRKKKFLNGKQFETVNYQVFDHQKILKIIFSDRLYGGVTLCVATNFGRIRPSGAI